MTRQEFTVKAYEILTKDGYKEIDGKIYFAENSVMKMLEWMHDNANTTPDVEKVMAGIIARIQSIF
jgi:hypothetical protein